MAQVCGPIYQSLAISFQNAVSSVYRWSFSLSWNWNRILCLLRYSSYHRSHLHIMFWELLQLGR